MKIPKKFLTAVVILGGLTALSSASAADSMAGSMTNTEDTTTSLLYPAQEVSVDLFGTGSINQSTIDHLDGDRIRHNGQLGLGGGLNYFFCRYVGVGADAYSRNTTGSFVESSSGSLFLRYPIMETGVAPYIFGGGGYDFEDIKQGFGQAGTGIEFRLAKHISLFVDARYVFADKTEDYGVGRAGFRFSF